jgi:putative membrane protein
MDSAMAAIALRCLIAVAVFLAPIAQAHVADNEISDAVPAAGAAAWGSAWTSAWTSGWVFEPWVIAALVWSGVLYLIGLRRLWRHAGPGRGVSVRNAAAFAAGWLCLAIALVSPLDPLGSRLFSAHMLQHEMLMVLAAPLLVVAKPLAVWVWALPLQWRRATGRFFHHRAWRAPWLVLTSPPGAWLVHALALWLWHVPTLFEAALRSNWVHTLQHFSFLFTALLFWWSALGQTVRAGQGAALVYLFTTMIHSSALGALLTLSPVVWYPAYESTAPMLGLSALEDQQLGGLVMWIPAGTAYFATGLLLATRWIGLNRQPTTS